MGVAIAPSRGMMTLEDRMATAPKARMTEDEYLALERASDRKSEFLDGEMFRHLSGRVPGGADPGPVRGLTLHPVDRTLTSTRNTGLLEKVEKVEKVEKGGRVVQVDAGSEPPPLSPAVSRPAEPDARGRSTTRRHRNAQR